MMPTWYCQNQVSTCCARTSSIDTIFSALKVLSSRIHCLKSCAGNRKWSSDCGYIHFSTSRVLHIDLDSLYQDPIYNNFKISIKISKNQIPFTKMLQVPLAFQQCGSTKGSWRKLRSLHSSSKSTGFGTFSTCRMEDLMRNLLFPVSLVEFCSNACSQKKYFQIHIEKCRKSFWKWTQQHGTLPHHMFMYHHPTTESAQWVFPPHLPLESLEYRSEKPHLVRGTRQNHQKWWTSLKILRLPTQALALPKIPIKIHTLYRWIWNRHPRPNDYWRTWRSAFTEAEPKIFS